MPETPGTIPAAPDQLGIRLDGTTPTRTGTGWRPRPCAWRAAAPLTAGGATIEREPIQAVVGRCCWRGERQVMGEAMVCRADAARAPPARG